MLGNRVYVNSVPRVRISPSPPYFKGLLETVALFLLLNAIRDSILDGLKNGRCFPINPKVENVDFRCSQVHASPRARHAVYGRLHAVYGH